MIVTVVLILQVAFALTCLTLGVAASRYPAVPGRVPFIIMMISIIVWSMSYSVMIILDSVEGMFLATVTQYTGIVLAPLGAVLFAYEYTRQQYTPLWVWPVLAIHPLITPLLVWLNPNSLFHSTQTIIQFHGYTLLQSTFGPLFWVHVAYSYLLILASIIIVLRAYFRAQQLYRQQMFWLLVGIIAPVVMNIITLSVRTTLDYTSLSFGLTGLGMGWSLFRYRLFDLMPVARDRVFENMPDAVFVLDPAGQIVDLNPAAEQIFGVASAEAIGKFMVDAFPAQKEAILPFSQVRDMRTEITVGEQIFDLQISPLSSRTRQNAGRLIVLRDITPRKKVEAERETLISELDAYAHTVAHDLKNPLGNVLGYAEDLAEFYDEMPEEERQADLQAIIRSAKSMNSIISNLLLLASVRNQDTIEATPVDMPKIVENVLVRLERVMAEAGAQVTLPDASAWLPAQGYAPWIEEIWANYLSNAVKYGGTPPHLTLGSAATANGQVRFYVRDNGPGLTPPEQQALFAQFSRLNQHRNLDGHGLGLSIVQRIAHKLNGRVGVESAPGAGTTFYFTLPASQG